MGQIPLVSCLCVSTKRLHHLRNAIDRFEEQSYPNKELLVVSASYDPEYVAFFESLGCKGVRYYWMEGDGNVTLGELRNYALKISTGDYFCVWDDDDWYHYKRIEIELKEATRNRKMGSLLAYCILFDAVNKTAFMSHILCPPASILCKKSVIDDDALYPARDRGEDSIFLNKLCRRNLLYPITRPDLYIYVYHGLNTTPGDQFNRFFTVRFSDKLATIVGDIVNGKYSKEKAARLLRGERFLREMDYLKNLIKEVEPEKMELPK
jgi:glycosyltransferase involved in cell wall biosynthesis